jgi:hypothetical protein
MNKDVIYIDVDDDITAIIGKVKDANEKIVALVPPKRIGVLQSAVNLRLLARAATQSNKHLVLISNNSALIALAAAAKVPVAKNLQSKPELAEIAALDVDDGEDIIDGSKLPIGELEKTADKPTSSAGSAIEDALRADAVGTMSRATPPAPGQSPVKPRAKSGIKVPNFNSFRKKLVFLIGGGVLFVGFLVWAIFFAPHATVQITARTSDSSVNAKVTLAQDAATNLAASTVKAAVQQSKKDVSLDFDATGTKAVGTKASGSMSISNCDYSSGFSLPSGTQFTADNGAIFVSTAAVTVPGYSSPSSTTCSLVGNSAGKATVAVQANDVGDSYNLSSRTYTVGTIPSGSKVTATGTDMANGESHQAKVVTADDIQKATDQMKQQSADTVKSQLKSQFGKTVTVLDSTFTVDVGSPTSTPAVGQELTAAKAKLTGSVNYAMTGVDSADFGSYLDAYFAKQISTTNNQRVYDNGAKNVSFTNVTAATTGFTVNIVATAKVGPKIDDNAIKDLAKGKRYGEIQSSIESIQGVDNVDIKFWPFWVSVAPNDTNKISVEFSLNG